VWPLTWVEGVPRPAPSFSAPSEDDLSVVEKAQ
jgi:hypothetical protein